MGVTGRLRTGAAVRAAMDAGSDYVSIGRAAILHPDLPRMLLADPDVEPGWLPVTPAYLRAQSVGEEFVDYLRTWRGFVADDPTDAARVRAPG